MKTQVIVIHGGQTFDTYEEYLSSLKELTLDFSRLTKKSWKNSLAEKLGDEYEVILPEMPNKVNAKYLEWKIYFNKIVPFLQDNVVLIGHSLGGIFLAKYLAEETLPIKSKALMLLAAPYDDSGLSGETLADFVLPASLDKIREQVDTVFLFHSKDDPVVPFNDVYKYQSQLPQAVLCIFDDKRHFNQEEFSEIIREIKSIV